MSTDELYLDALRRFSDLMLQARQTSAREPTAVALATADAGGRPSARMVLLRGVDARGFVFFTNANSRKGTELAANPHAELCFYWEQLDQQVRVGGRVEDVSDEESDEYWNRRPRASRIAAWASSQSETLEDGRTLERRFDEFDRRYPGEDVPRPAHWHGYRVVPERIEFWEKRPSRLHHRELYERAGDRWTVRRLYP